MNDVCQSDPQVFLYISNDDLRNFVTLGRQSKHLFSRNTFGPGTCDTLDGGFRLGLLD